MTPSTRSCPCGSETAYDTCCAPLLAHISPGETPEQVMRSRYTAHVLNHPDHLFRTWHPRTRPDDVTPDPTTRWTGLEIVDTGPDTVEFIARWEGGQMHEVSQFEQRAGRWVYVDGVQR